MGEFFQDVRYSVRTLLRHKGFAFVTILTLALGIGANTAVFSVFNAVMLKPLPYDAPEELALVWTNFGEDLPQNWISGPEFSEISQFNTVFEHFAVASPLTVSITGDGDPEQVSAVIASGNFFDVLSVVPQLGRTLNEEDDQRGKIPVIVLGDGFWKRRFGADPGIVGNTVNVNGFSMQVVGVLPPGFEVLHPDANFPDRIDVWLPILPAYAGLAGAPVSYEELSRGSHGLRGFGRLKSEFNIAEAQTDMDRVAVAMSEKNPNVYGFPGWGLTVYSMHADLVEEARPALLLVLGAVGFVLLIACVNVANLMLGRANVREREMAVRTALGAGRTRIFRQLLTESVVISLAGGLVGVGLAYAGLNILVAMTPETLPRRGDIGVDVIVLAFSFVTSVGAGLLFGMAPAFFSAKQDVSSSFKEGGRGTTLGTKGRRTQAGLVVAEVALALVLLVGAGLMVRSFQALTETDPGFVSEGLMTARIPLPSSAYSGEQVNVFWDRLVGDVANIPGVISAGAISQLPLSSSYSSGTTWVDDRNLSPDELMRWEVERRTVTPGYFETMRSELVSGRFFGPEDRAGARLVAIVDETFVARAWPGENPLGKRIAIGMNEEMALVWREVVGVVRHQKHYGLNTIGREQAYYPMAQRPSNTMFLVARVERDPASIVARIREQVRSLDPNQPVTDINAMSGLVQASLAPPRFNLTLLGGFAVIALILASVGIYGVISYGVSQRSHEIGLRMALGAEASQVIGLLFREGFILLAVGLGSGTLISLAMARYATSMLFEISATDPLTYLVVGGLLAAVGSAAILVPARRATKVEPMVVLTTE